MPAETYSLEEFVVDLDRITSRESAPETITAQIAPLLGRLHVYGKDLHGLPRKTWVPDGRVSPLVSPKYANC